MDSKDIKIKCKDGEIAISSEITKLSPYLKEMVDKSKSNSIDLKDFEKQNLEFLIKFCDAHKWCTDTMKYKNPSEWTSHLLREQIDDKSWSVFKQLLGSEIADNPQKFEVYFNKIIPLVELAFLLKFIQFRKICNVALQIPGYYDYKSANDNYSKEYQSKWGIAVDMQDPEQQHKLIDEYAPCFKSLNDNWKNEIQQITTKEQ